MEVLNQASPDKAPPEPGVECTICLSNEAKEVGVLKCQHTYCFECIEGWSEHENSCPLCKVRFTYIDKVSKEALQEVADGKRKRINKERVKIKRKNQGDYEPAFHSHDGVDVWAQFIASLVGAGNQQLRRFQQGLAADLPFPMFGAGYNEAPRRRRVVPGTRVIRPTRRLPTVGETANNPIALLSDDEGEGNGQSRGQNSSSTRSAPVVVDLTEEGDDVPWGPALASTSATAGSAVGGGRAVTGRTGSGFHQQLGAQPQYSDSEEGDEDFDPVVGLGISESDRDSDDSNDFVPDQSLLDFLEEESVDDGSNHSAAEVIELSDTGGDSGDDAGRSHGESRAAGGPTQRLSGVMVWCRDCDTFHDKQRVRDDRSYCPAMYDALLQNEDSNNAGSIGGATPTPGSGEGSDDENAPWLESRSQQGVGEMKLPLARTQSDATTASSRSSSSSSSSACNAVMGHEAIAGPAPCEADASAGQSG